MPTTRKTVYHFEAVSGKLTDEYKDPLKEAVLAAVLQEADITNFMLTTRLNSFSTNLSSYLKYGQDGYERGLPEGTHSYGHVPADIVKSSLESILGGAPVVIDGVSIEEPVLDYFGLQYLQTQFSSTWDPVERSLLTSSNVKYFFVGAAVSTRDATKLRIALVRDGHVLLPDGTTTKGYASISIALPPDKPYYHVRFHRATESINHTRYWAYDPTTRAHPDLDNWFTENPLQSEFYPIVPIRIDRDWVNSEKTHNGVSWKDRYHYESCKDLLKKVNVDIDDLITGVGKKENGEDDVDDLDQINDVFFQFAVDIYTEEPQSIEYLFGTFKHLDYQATLTKRDYVRAMHSMMASDAIADIPPPNFFRVEEDDFKSTIKWNYTEITQETGALEKEFEKEIVIEKPFKKTFTIAPDPGTTLDTDQSYNISITIEQSQVLLKRRTGPDSYEQVKVHGLKHSHYVEGYDRVRRVDKVLDADYIDSDEEEFKVGKSAFFIPLSWRMMEEMNMGDQAPVAYDAMMITINAVDKKHLKWYQSGLFAFILKVVMIAISIWVFIASGGMAAYISATLWELAVMMFSGFAMNFIVGLLMEHLGDIGLIIALVLAVAAAWTGMGVGQGLKGLPFAQQLLGSTSSVAGVLKKYVALGMEELQNEMTEFIKDAEEMEEEHQKAEDFLDTNSYMNPLFITGFAGTIPPEETPDIYFRRCIHEKNIGVLTLDAIHDYHSDALKLPEPDFFNTEYSFA